MTPSGVYDGSVTRSSDGCGGSHQVDTRKQDKEMSRKYINTRKYISLLGVVPALIYRINGFAEPPLTPTRPVTLPRRREWSSSMYAEFL